jgi:F0F1-type ATP synthase membrane subunit c/vacuolar-type H+-ATPase subunit K
MVAQQLTYVIILNRAFLSLSCAGRRVANATSRLLTQDVTLKEECSMYTIRRDGWFFRFAYSWHRQNVPLRNKVYFCDTVSFAMLSLVAYGLLIAIIVGIAVSVAIGVGMILYTGVEIIAAAPKLLRGQSVTFEYLRESSALVFTLSPVIVLYTRVGAWIRDAARTAATIFAITLRKIKQKYCAEVEIV